MRNHNRKYQPFFDQRADYNTNAKSYYDYLGKMGYFFHVVEDTENRLLARDLEVETSSSILLTKTGNWQDDENGNFDDVIKISAESRISTTDGNIISVASDGLYAPPTDLGDINGRLDEIENDIENIENGLSVIQGDITNITDEIHNIKTTGNVLQEITDYVSVDITNAQPGAPVQIPLKIKSGYQGVGYLRLEIRISGQTSPRGIFVPVSIGGIDTQQAVYVNAQNPNNVVKIQFDVNQTTSGYLTVSFVGEDTSTGASDPVDRVTFTQALALMPLEVDQGRK